MATNTYTHQILVDWNNDGLFSNANSDITKYFLTADWTIGRQQNLNVSGPILMANIAAGQIIVRNESKLFTNTSVSPLFGKLLPRRKIKIIESVSFQGITLTNQQIFYGVIRGITSQSSSKTTDRKATIEIADLVYILQSTKTGIPVQYNQALDTILQAYVSTAFGNAANSLVFVFNAVPANGSTLVFDTIPNVAGQQPGTGTITFTFDSSGGSVANHISTVIGTAAGVAANFAAAINQIAGLGTLYGTVSPPLADFQAVAAGATVTVTSVLAGNSLAAAFSAHVHGTGTAISVAGSTTNDVVQAATGGVDYPITFDSPRKSRTVLPIAGQRWTKKDTFAYTAIKEMVDTEMGRFHQNPAGNLVFHSRDYNFNRSAVVPLLNDYAHGIGNYKLGTSDDDTFGVVRITSTPNNTVQKGVVIGKLSGASIPGNSTKTIHVPYTDWQSGAPIGGVPTLPLVPGQDWNVNEKPDGSGIDYTPGYYFGGTVVTMSFTQLASGLDVKVTNTATGVLYFVPPKTPKAGQSGTATLQVRGTAITNFASVISEKATDYTRRVMSFTLPLTDDTNYADSVANYLSGRYTSDTAKITEVTYGEKGLYPVPDPAIGSPPILAASIGDILDYSRAADGLTLANYLEITGMKIHLEPQKAETTLYTWPVDTQTWFILNHPTFGLLNGLNKLAI